MPKTASQVLADNLTALAASSRSDCRTQREIARVAKIDQRTVGRIMAAKHNAGVDKIEALAQAFKVPAWHLLYPGLEPDSAPGVVAFSVAAKELARAYDALPDGREKQDLLAVLLGKLQMRSPSARPTPDEPGPSAQPRLSRAPAQGTRTGKSRVRT